MKQPYHGAFFFDTLHDMKAETRRAARSAICSLGICLALAACAEAGGGAAGVAGQWLPAEAALSAWLALDEDASPSGTAALPAASALPETAALSATAQTHNAALEALSAFSAYLEGWAADAGRRQPSYLVAAEDVSAEIRERAAALVRAVGEGRRDEAAALRGELQERIIRHQHTDVLLLKAIGSRYLYLFLFLTGLILVFALLVQFLHRSLGGSLAREQETAAFSRLKTLAQEEERGRISRELHDTVAQSLRSLGFMISGISRSAEDAERRTLCGEAAAEQRAILDTVRNICTSLVPPDFRRWPLTDLLRQLCADFTARTGLACPVSIEAGLAPAFSPEGNLQCYRLVQEALTNIEKHAGAGGASLILRRGPAGKEGRPGLLICITDDGRGFARTPTADTASTLGIRGMFERAAILGGSLSFITEPGEGTMVQAALPAPA